MMELIGERTAIVVLNLEKAKKKKSGKKKGKKIDLTETTDILSEASTQHVHQSLRRR